MDVLCGVLLDGGRGQCCVGFLVLDCGVWCMVHGGLGLWMVHNCLLWLCVPGRGRMT